MIIIQTSSHQYPSHAEYRRITTGCLYSFLNPKIRAIMPYYLKISYQSKTKKFIVRNPKEISLAQIRNTFVPPIPPCARLSYLLTYRTEHRIALHSEEELLGYLAGRVFAEGESVRVTAEEVEEAKEESDNQQFYQQFLQGNKVSKTRSRSEELDSSLLTNEFVVRSAEQSLCQSMRVSGSLMSEAEDFIKDKERQLARLKQERRETNTMELLEFLYRRKS